MLVALEQRVEVIKVIPQEHVVLETPAVPVVEMLQELVNIITAAMLVGPGWSTHESCAQ